MGYIKLSEARRIGRATLPPQRSARRVLASEARRFDVATRYDVFLSHSSDDAEVIYGVKTMIENMGLRVYVDWIEDAQLDRSQVTVKTAAMLRERMTACSSLVYAHSATSSDSAWMPWELGYFDGLRGKHVWILPLVAINDSEFRRQAYLGLYPAIKNLGDLADGLSLGFDRVGDDHHVVLLEDAVRGGGVFKRG